MPQHWPLQASAFICSLQTLCALQVLAFTCPLLFLASVGTFIHMPTAQLIVSPLELTCPPPSSVLCRYLHSRANCPALAKCRHLCSHSLCPNLAFAGIPGHMPTPSALRCPPPNGVCRHGHSCNHCPTASVGTCNDRSTVPHWLLQVPGLICPMPMWPPKASTLTYPGLYKPTAQQNSTDTCKCMSIAPLASAVTSTHIPNVAPKSRPGLCRHLHSHAHLPPLTSADT